MVITFCPTRNFGFAFNRSAALFVVDARPPEHERQAGADETEPDALDRVPLDEVVGRRIDGRLRIVGEAATAPVATSYFLAQ